MGELNAPRGTSFSSCVFFGSALNLTDLRSFYPSNPLDVLTLKEIAEKELP